VIRRSPCESYLKYLVVHPDNYRDESIKTLVQMQQLDFIGMEYLKNLRSVCIPPTPFFPEDKLHTRSGRFLQKERLVTIFHPDDAMQAAAGILDNARAKELVETMLIGRSHHSWICTALRRQGVDIPLDAVARYKHYYFNVDLVDSSELKALMHARSHVVSGDDADVQRLGVAEIAVHKSDTRRNAAMWASPISAHIMNNLRLGLMPNTVEIARLAEATRAAALGGCLDMAMRGLPAQGRDYSIMAKMMTEILESVGDPGDDLREGLARLSIETDTRIVPHISQLSAGAHTLDVQSLEMNAEVDDNE